MPDFLRFIILFTAGWVNRHQQAAIEYLQEENRVLREHIPGRRLRFTDDQRRRLALKAQALGRRGLRQIVATLTPDTLLRWYRTLIARKYDGSAVRGPGRPRTKQDIAGLVATMANENPTWGYTRIKGALVNLGIAVGRNTVKRILNGLGIVPAPERGLTMPWKTFLAAHCDAIAAADFFTVEVLTLYGLIRYHDLFFIDIATRRVHIAGVSSQPNATWVAQIARNLTDPDDGFLAGFQVAIMDNDPLFASARGVFQGSGMKVPKLPAQSPNVNPLAGRFVLSVRTDCLSKVIPLGESHLRSLLAEYIAHYHSERNHQGIGNRLISPDPHVGATDGPIKAKRGLGGILSYYYREAA